MTINRIRSDDVAIVKYVNRELVRHNIDYSLLQVYVSGGVVRIQGAIKTTNQNVEEDLKRIKRILMWNTKIKDVIIEVTIK
jgi:hypothetical protein